MSLLTNIFPRQKYRLPHPFKALPSIEHRAFSILKAHSEIEINAAALLIVDAVTQFIEDDIETETITHIDRLYNRGGWELSYLGDEDDRYGTSRRDIEDLIRSWPSHFADKPDVPKFDDYDQLNVLQEVLDDANFQHLIYPGGSKAIEFSPHEFFAVFALIQVNGALEVLTERVSTIQSGQMLIPLHKPLMAGQLINAGNLLLTAMEAVCLGERYLSDETLEEHRERAKHERVERERLERELREKEGRSQAGKDIANARWAKEEDLRERALKLIATGLEEWDRNRTLYRNQGDFARAMESKMPLGSNDEPIYLASTIQVKLIQKARALKSR